MLPLRPKRGGAATPPRTNPPSSWPAPLCRAMLRQWAAPDAAPVAQVGGLARFVARRAALSAAFAGDTLVVPSGTQAVRANDTHYRFRPDSNFFYLVGHTEPDCVLVLAPCAHGRGHKSVLYIEPERGRRDVQFFTDSHKGALWVGPRLTLAACRARYGLDACRPITMLPAFLEQQQSGHRQPQPSKLQHRARPGHRQASPPTMLGQLRWLPGPGALALGLGQGRIPARQVARNAALAAHLGYMRLTKDAGEVAAIARACASTQRGFNDVVALLPHARTERELEAAFGARARLEGHDVGYNTIAAGGANACILHWTRNDARLKKRDLVLLDAGIEGASLYTADITRTLPIGGRFSRAQAAVYDLVLAAQDAALGVIRAGVAFAAVHRAATEVLARGLEALGLLPCAEYALRPDVQTYRRYTLHGTAHMLGLDVHDCAHAPSASYRAGTLRPGMVLTVEPGLYLQKDDLTVPRRLRGIGVRIEDNLVVTARGYRMLSHLPRTRDAVETWVRAIRRGQARRTRKVTPC